MLSALSENQQTISYIYLVPSEIQIQVVCVTKCSPMYVHNNSICKFKAKQMMLQFMSITAVLVSASQLIIEKFMKK